MATELEMDTCDSCGKEIEAIPNEIVRCEDCWAKHWDAYKKPTNSCTCLDSPNMLAGPCQACSGDDFETGEIVQVSNCTFIGGSTDDDVVVKFNSSPFEYCLPGSVIRHIPPAHCECGKQYAKIDGVTYCPDCTTAMTGLTESELRQALADPVEAKEPWKPKPNEPLLVAAIAKQWCGDKWIIEIDGKAAWQGVDNQLIVNASQLRPLPVVQGEGVGK